MPLGSNRLQAGEPGGGRASAEPIGGRVPLNPEPPLPPEQSVSGPGFLRGGGEVGAAMRAHDWAKTPLGPPDAWPQPLRTALRLLLSAGHPTQLWWGPGRLSFHNDAYRASIGCDAESLGRPEARKVWKDVGPHVEL